MLCPTTAIRAAPVRARCTTPSTGVTNSGSAASSSRSAIGSDSTHCRTGPRGMT